jgi:hypothetical protein
MMCQADATSGLADVRIHPLAKALNNEVGAQLYAVDAVDWSPVWPGPRRNQFSGRPLELAGAGVLLHLDTFLDEPEARVPWNRHPSFNRPSEPGTVADLEVFAQPTALMFYVEHRL